jgi:hypothetical protein
LDVKGKARKMESEEIDEVGKKGREALKSAAAEARLTTEAEGDRACHHTKAIQAGTCCSRFFLISASFSR